MKFRQLFPSAITAALLCACAIPPEPPAPVALVTPAPAKPAAARAPATVATAPLAGSHKVSMATTP